MAFDKLKKQFNSAPILHHHDPALPYVLEVDASETAVGAILSHRHETTAMLHPVAFFSRKLSPAERNYDVGDRELLAIKMALEEWRYLLEGASHPILIYTDHRNLEYLCRSKRLRPRQARWALFFTQFQMHITYRPGSKNCKPDALSRMYPTSDNSPTTDAILPAYNFFLLTDDLLSRIKLASSLDQLPSGEHLQENDRLFFHDHAVFVPLQLRVPVLKLRHDNKLAD